MRQRWRCRVLPGLVMALAGCGNLPLQQQPIRRAPADTALPPLPAAHGVATLALVAPSRAQMEEQRTAALLADAQRRGIYDRQTLIGASPPVPPAPGVPALPHDARPGDCYVLVPVPAQLRSGLAPYGVRPAYQQLEYVPPRYVEVAAVGAAGASVLTAPGGYAPVVVPAQPVNVAVQEIGSPARLVWQQTTCANAAPTAKDLTRAQIRALQDALRDRGYDPGPSDGIIGRRTHRALDAFQQAQRLPQEPQLNLPTLAGLGLSV